MRISLPVDNFIKDIHLKIQQESSLVIEAAPGTGKTTRIPPSLLEISHKKIIVLEPRRLAAKMSAERVAQERGESCGQTVGYSVRFDNKTSKQTRLTYMTEGLFLRKIQQDPELEGIEYVVLDEFHERNLHSDVSLMLLRRLQKDKPELKIIVMSATLNTQLLTHKLKSPLISIPGQTFPVDIEYLGPQMTTIDPQTIVKSCHKMLESTQKTGHILVFLPGSRDIHNVAQALESTTPGVEIRKLYADLPKQQQNLVFQNTSKRKIILATNIAETSLTIPNIIGVVDPGLAKISGYTHWSGMPTLSVQKVSQAAMNQRAGRAGRTQKGLVYRLCTQDEFLKRKPHTQIDIHTQDLSSCLLAIYNIASLSSAEKLDILNLLPWLETPSQKHFIQANELLTRLGLITLKKTITEFGHQCLQYPFHPRVASVAAAGISTESAADALLAACLIQEGRVSKDRPRILSDCDISYQMDSIKGVMDSDEAWKVDAKKIEQIKKIFKQCQSLGPNTLSWPTQATQQEKIRLFILRGFLDRVAKRQIQKTNQKQNKAQISYRYHFCLGRGGKLHENSSLKFPEFLIAIDAMEEEKRDAAKGTMITLGCKVEIEELKTITSMLETQITEEKDTKTGETQLVSQLSYGNWVLETSYTTRKIWTSDQLISKLTEDWGVHIDSRPVDQYHLKAKLIKQHIGDELPLFEEDLFEVLCSMICEDLTSPTQISPSRIQDKILESLTWEEQNLLKEKTPNSIKAANGKIFTISYDENHVSIQGRVQDFYGLKSAPCILASRLPLTLKILAPNDRICQISNNLYVFWVEQYPKLCSEFQRKYPRHHWPLDPSQAKPIRTKRQLLAQ